MNQPFESQHPTTLTADRSDVCGRSAGRKQRRACRPFWYGCLVGCLALWGAAGCGPGRDRAPNGGREHRSGTTRPTSRPTAWQEFDRPFAVTHQGRELLRLDQIAPKPEFGRATTGPSRPLPPQAKSRLMLARKHLDAHRYADALAELEKARRYAPAAFQVLRMLGEVYSAQGENALAAEHYREAIKSKPNDLRCRFLLGQFDYDRGDPDSALRHWRLAARCPRGPDDAAVAALTLYRLGTLLHRQGYLTAALEVLERFVRLGDPALLKGPEAPLLRAELQAHPAAVLMLLGQCHLELGRPVQASRFFQQAVEVAPADAKANEMLLRSLVYAGKTRAALRRAEKIIHAGPFPDRLQLVCTWVFYRAGKADQLADELKRMRRRRQKDPAAALRIAKMFGYLGRPGEAIRSLKPVVDRKGTPLEVHGLLVKLLLMQGRFDEILITLARGLAGDPAHHTQLVQFAEVFGQGDLKDYLRSRGPALAAARPDDWAIQYLIGRLLAGAGESDHAERLLRRAIAIRPDFVPPYQVLGKLLIDGFRWKDLKALVGSAPEATRSSIALVRLAAEAYDGLDEYGAAEQAFRQVLSAEADDLPALLGLVRVYLRRPQPQVNKARKELARFIKANPKSAAAREALISTYLDGPPGWSGTPNRSDLQDASKELEAFSRHCRSTAGYRRLAAKRDYYERRRKFGTRMAIVVRAFVASLGRILRAGEDLDTRLEMAAALIALHQYDQAERVLSDAARKYPRSPRVLELYTQVDRFRLRLEQALGRVRTLLSWYPNRWQYHQLLLDAALDLQDYRLAEAQAGWLLQKPFDDRKKRALQASRLGALIRDDKQDQAVKLARKLAAGKYEDRGSQLGYTLLYYEVLFEARRLETLNRLLAPAGQAGKPAEKQAPPPLPDALLADRLYRLRQLQGRFDEAEQIARDRLKSSDDPLVALDWQERLLRALMGAGKFHRMLEQVKKFRPQKAGNDFRALYRRLSLDQYEATALVGLGRRKQALALVRKLERDVRDQLRPPATAVLPDLLERISTLYLYAGRPALAELMLKDALDINPFHAAACNDLGYFWADRGTRLERAEQMIRIAAGLRPRLGAYLDSLGWVLYKQGKFSEAVVWLQRAVRADPFPDAVVLDHLGDAYWRAGSRDRAQQTWKQALASQSRRIGWQPEVGETVTAKQKIEQVRQGRQPEVAPVPTGRASG